jgi:hypothetical protein
VDQGVLIMKFGVLPHRAIMEFFWHFPIGSPKIGSTLGDGYF